jgi:hypothetical protein
MSDSGKIGVVALVLWLGGTVLALRAPPPMGFALSFISFVLGCIAAWRGSRWWLTLPFAMLIELGVGVYVACRAL